MEMTSWAKEAKATRSSRYIGLIAIPGGGGLGWTAPRFRAGLLRSDGPGRDFVVEPARLIHHEDLFEASTGSGPAPSCFRPSTHCA